MDQVCLKVNRKIGALRRSFRQLTPTARRAFFLSVIQPDLEYAASAIVPSMAASQKNRLLATWRRAVWCAAGSGYQENVAPLVKQLKIVSLEHRWALQVAEIVFRCNHGSAPSSSALKDKSRRNNHGARTRGSKLAVSSFFVVRRAVFFKPCSPDVEHSSACYATSLFTYSKPALNDHRFKRPPAFSDRFFMHGESAIQTALC